MFKVMLIFIIVSYKISECIIHDLRLRKILGKLRKRDVVLHPDQRPMCRADVYLHAVKQSLIIWPINILIDFIASSLHLNSTAVSDKQPFFTKVASSIPHQSIFIVDCKCKLNSAYNYYFNADAASNKIIQNDI